MRTARRGGSFVGSLPYREARLSLSSLTSVTAWATDRWARVSFSCSPELPAHAHTRGQKEQNKLLDTRSRHPKSLKSLVLGTRVRLECLSRHKEKKKRKVVPPFPPHDVIGVSCCLRYRRCHGSGGGTVLPQVALQFGSSRKFRQLGVGTPRRPRHSLSLELFAEPTARHARFCDIHFLSPFLTQL